MKLDRFLAVLFSKRTLAFILALTLALGCLTACELTLEDVFCLAFCGCLSLGTCRDLIMKCNCECGNCGYEDFEGEYVDCSRSNCIGEAYNGCFGCIWDGGLKDCRPSAACDKCSSDEDDYDYEYSAPTSCDDCVLDCMEACIYD